MLRLEANLRNYYGDEEYEKQLATSVTIARMISQFAHRDQKRLDSSPYYNHPYSMAVTFRYLTCMDNPHFDSDKLYSYDIPYDGVIELCLLHDVVEDTEYTEDEIADIFYDNGLETYYNLYIKEPLHLIAHDKSEPYPVYIEKVCKNPISAMVKMLDLQNNLEPFSLDVLGDKELKRAQDYYKYIKVINDEYHFIEKLHLFQESIIKANEE